MAIRDAVDADFTKASLQIAYKLDIYFDGTSNSPVTVTHDTHLIDVSWLEESMADSSNPFGAVSSNEMSFRLYNPDGLFSPANVNSVYYGKIKKGLCIVPYIRPVSSVDTINWIQLGKYYVTDWVLTSSNIYVDVTACDIWQQIFNSPTPLYFIEQNLSYTTALQNIFTAMGYSVTIDVISQVLRYSYILGRPIEFIQSLMQAALAFCTCNKSGNPVIKALVGTKSTRATFTDSDQIKEVKTTQSVVKIYEGVKLTYATPQIVTAQDILSIEDQSIPSSSSLILSDIAFNNVPIFRIRNINIIDTSGVVINNYNASPSTISMTLDNTTAQAALVAINVVGDILKLTETTLSDSTVNLLSMNNAYIQNKTYALYYKDILTRYITNSVPILTVFIRGNPLLNLGDKIVINSNKYKINFTGIVVRLQYSYDGGLSCEMTLLNSQILEV